MERSTGLRGSTATLRTCEKAVVLWGSCVWGSGFWRRVTRVSGLQRRRMELWRFGVKFRVAVFKVTACKQVCRVKGICIISWRCDRLGLWCTGTEALVLSLRGRDEISRSWEGVIFPGFLCSSSVNWSLESFHRRWKTFSADDLTTANLGLLQLLVQVYDLLRAAQPPAWQDTSAGCGSNRTQGGSMGTVWLLGGLPFSPWMMEYKVLVSTSCRERSISRKWSLKWWWKLHLGVNLGTFRKFYTFCLHIIHTIRKKKYPLTLGFVTSFVIRISSPSFSLCSFHLRPIVTWQLQPKYQTYFNN